MSSLVETLYPLPDYRRTPLSLLRWWESRRLKYNAAVGSAGLVTLATVHFFVWLLPGAAAPPLLDVVGITLAYAAMANVCYTLGYATETLARLVWGRQAPPLGPLLFREGLIFSVGLTLLPILVLGFVAVANLLEIVLS